MDEFTSFGYKISQKLVWVLGHPSCLPLSQVLIINNHIPIFLLFKGVFNIYLTLIISYFLIKNEVDPV